MQPVVIGGVIIVPETIRANLDGNGQINILIPATNDPDLNVTGWTYTVTEHMDNGRGPYQIEVPYTVGSLDLATVPFATPNPSVPSSAALHLSDVGTIVVGVPALANASNGASLVGYTPPSTGIAGTVKSFLDALWSTGGSLGASLIRWIQSGTGAQARSAEDRFRDTVSALDFMTPAQIADLRAGTLNLDLTAAINAALLAHKTATLPACNARVDGPVQFTQSGNRLLGAGRGATMLWSKSTTAKMFTFTTGINDVQIGQMTLDRTVTATAGAHGIDCSNIAVLGQSRFFDLNVRHQYIGIALGSTDFSYLQDTICERNQSHGIYMTNSSATALQWNLENVLCQLNGGRGIEVVSQVFGGGNVSMGTWTNINTFANTGGGIWLNGAATRRIQAFRLENFFVGEDGSDAIRLDTYGTLPHTLRNGFIELTGVSATGPTASTPASNTGYGIEATANNAHLDITNVHSEGNSYNGFHFDNTSVNMSGCSACNNGAALVAGNRYGAEFSTTTRATVTGGWYGNISGNTNQQYGLVPRDGDTVAIHGVDLTGNSVGTHVCITNPLKLTILGCLPNTVENRLPGGLAVGIVAASPATGVVNASVNVQLNGTNYTNP